MDRYSLEEPPCYESYDEEGTAEGRRRRVGIVIALVGLLMMTISILGGWVPWSLYPGPSLLALVDVRGQVNGAGGYLARRGTPAP